MDGTSSGQGLSQTCIVCKATLNRSQDLDRHIQSYHLPCCVYCPCPGCLWRGCRTDELRTHFERHLGPNQDFTDLEEYLIYDVKLILECVKEAKSDDYIRSAQDLAINLVLQRANELGKVEWLADPGCCLEQREKRAQRPRRRPAVKPST